MKIAVVSALKAGSLRASAINAVKMAEGFARCGHEVWLLTLGGWPRGNRKLKELYGIEEKIIWKRLPFFIGSGYFFAQIALMIVKRINPCFVYCRSYSVPWLFQRNRIPVVMESHAHPDNRSNWFMRMLQSTNSQYFKAWVTINNSLVKSYRKMGAEDKFLILADAVDEKLFRRPVNGLPESPFKNKGIHVSYCGHLYDYKGIATILEAASLLKGEDVTFHFVGGLPEDIRRQKMRAAQMHLENVVFHGLVSHSRVPLFLWYSDILLMVPSANHPSAQWTSPVKAGEYLMSGVPVVASAIPALKDWFLDGEVYFIEPDDYVQLSEAIKKIIDNTELAEQLIEKGLEWARLHSYKRRAESIIQYITAN